MKPKIYLESSVISYLVARPSRDLIAAANQEITREWWEKAAARFDLFISEIVLLEISAGDLQAAHARRESVADVPALQLTPEARELADAFLMSVLPPRAATDALHIALATVYAMDYLVTWNCAHIANALMQRRIAEISRGHGYIPPVICTPQELMEEEA